MSSLPFSIDTSYSELAHTEGVARLTREGLTLEFQVKDAFFGVLKSAPREKLIPAAEIAEASFKPGLFSGVLTIRAHGLSAVDSVPGASQGVLKLKCKRKYRELARELASRLSMKALENDVRELSQSSSALLHPPPPA